MTTQTLERCSFERPVQLRAAAEGSTSPGTLVGYAAVFNQRSRIGDDDAVLAARDDGGGVGAFDIDDYSTAGLACDFTRFHHDGVLAPLEGFGDFVEYGHGVFP